MNKLRIRGQEIYYNVTLRRVRAAIFAMEQVLHILILWVCVCSIRYPVCNAHAP